MESRSSETLVIFSEIHVPCHVHNLGIVVHCISKYLWGIGEGLWRLLVHASNSAMGTDDDDDEDDVVIMIINPMFNLQICLGKCKCHLFTHVTRKSSGGR